KISVAVKAAFASLDNEKKDDESSPDDSTATNEKTDDAGDAKKESSETATGSAPNDDPAKEAPGAEAPADAANKLPDAEAAIDKTTGDAAPATPAHTDWERIEALYDYARAHVSYLEGPDKSAVRALTDGKGDCQAIAALFVAMCRTAKVPARMVWV